MTDLLLRLLCLLRLHHTPAPHLVSDYARFYPWWKCRYCGHSHHARRLEAKP